MKARLLWPVVLIVSVLVMVSLYSPRAAAPAPFPPPPYVPQSPAEDIIKVEAWVEKGSPNRLHLTVTFAAPTPPAGNSLMIIVTRLQAGSEVNFFGTTYNGAPTIVLSFSPALFDGGEVNIAVYAELGPPSTDRAPNVGFYAISSSSSTSPNVYYDYESIVGGVVLPTNNLTILAPYLVMIGLVATTAIAIKRHEH